MSIQGAMYSGISGLSSNGIAMEVIGNNIANINTPAYKFSRPEFSDILAKNMGMGYSIGRGANVTGVDTLFTQGSFQTTNNVTDVALEGKGFFVLKDSNETGNYYTRAGNFHIDELGYITNSEGLRVQGYLLDERGIYTGTPQDIKIPTTPLSPKPTSDGSTLNSGVQIAANLDSNSQPIASGFDITNPTGTSHFTTSITVYDSLGNGHQVSVYFTKIADGSWQWNVAVDASDTASGSTEVQASGTLTFDTQGRLSQETTTTNSFNFNGGCTQNQVIGFNFGTSLAESGTGLDGTTQFGDVSSLHYQSQDGYSPAYLQSLEIDNNGVIIGKYANGETKKFYQLAVANFQNPNGLSKAGGNLFGETTTSGEPLISVANVSGNGRIFSDTLEMSNVDLAEQFVSMIATQRGFQANSRSITTTDEMLSDLVNLKR